MNRMGARWHAVQTMGRLAATCTLLMTCPCVVAQGGPASTDRGAANSDEECALSARSNSRAVVRVIDGATLALDDGSQVRLIGALSPSALDASLAPAARNQGDKDAAASGVAAARDQQWASDAATVTTPNPLSAAPSHAQTEAWKPAVAAHAALAQLVEGRSVTLATAGRQRDRYNRVLAHVFATAADGGVVWLQGAMLAAGHARAYGIAENFACIDALMAAEAPAREARRGLWANPVYAIQSATHTRALMRLRSTYQIVAGEVRKSQRTKSGWIYLNFGDDWRNDFSASIAPGLSRAHPAWAASLLDLKGRRLRVRGWIERRNGPSINIEHPSQIEILDEGSARRTPPPTVVEQ